jgi:hypothetical protein
MLQIERVRSVDAVRFIASMAYKQAFAAAALETCAMLLTAHY